MVKERSGRERVAGMHEVDTSTAISTQLVALVKKVDGWATNQIVNAPKWVLSGQ